MKRPRTTGDPELNKTYRNRAEDLGFVKTFNDFVLGNVDREDLSDDLTDEQLEVIDKFMEQVEQHREEPTEGTESTEYSEDELINELLAEEPTRKKRLSGILQDETYFHILFLQKDNEKTPYVITGNGDIRPVDENSFVINDQTYELKHEIGIPPENDLYCPDNGILRFLKDEEPRSEIYGEIRELVEQYWDHYDEHWFDVVTAWIIHTYLIMGTSYTVYLLLHGGPDTGKSSLQKVISRLAYNGFFTGKATPAVTSRMAHLAQATISQDEFDKLSPGAKKEIQGVYNSGQRKGSKYTFTNTNRNKIAEQIASLHSYCAKTISVNNIDHFERSFLTRNIIIQTARTNRNIPEIEGMNTDTQMHFQQMRNETCAYVLKHHEDILKSVNRYKSQLDESGRNADKIGLICGIVEHFNDAQKAEEVEKHLRNQEDVTSPSMEHREQLILERVITKFNEEGGEIVELPAKELAEHVNRNLGLDEDDQYAISPATVRKRLNKYNLIRDNSQVSRSGANGNTVYTFMRGVVEDSLKRYELFDLLERLDGADTPSDPSVPSVSSEDARETVLEAIEELDDGDGVSYEELQEETELAEDVLEDALNEVISDGTCYEPQPGRVKTL